MASNKSLKTGGRVYVEPEDAYPFWATVIEDLGGGDYVIARWPNKHKPDATKEP